MNGQLIWSIAIHEMRALQRLLRTHVFIWTAVLICAAYFVTVTLTHMYSATDLPMLGIISPRYILSLLGGSFIGLFCIGVLLLTFDQIKRDEMNRIHEVVGSKPLRNFELFLGRLTGVSLMMAIPMLFVLFSMLTYGIIAETFSIPFGEPVELWSVISFVILDIFPNFLFFGSLVLLFASLFKSRLIALFMTFSFLVLVFWLNSRISLDVSKPLQTVSGNVLFPSELTPTLFTPVTLFNRISLLLVSVGLLCWVSCFSSRITSSRSRDLMLGGLFTCIGVLIIAVMFGLQSWENRHIDHWIRVHDQNFLPRSFPDVQEIRGLVDIKPGQLLSIDLTLDVSLDTLQDSGFVLFSLNPGYKISKLAVGGVKVEDGDFQNGLLKIPSTYFSPGTNELKISAKGRPDGRFAYLDSVATLSEISGLDVRQLRQLGTENFIYRPEFVALVPGIKWYPTSGTATNEDAWETRERDFFTLDIDVVVPKNWLVAGPAKRESSDDTKRTTYSFQQSSPLPEFALIGSRFKSGSIEVDGITFEILYNYKHRKTFEHFVQIVDHIRSTVSRWYVEKFQTHGLSYPYSSFTVVEVPSTLRVFGGGVTMDTVMCPPGMVMIRESTLPTISIESLIDFNREEMLKRPDFTMQDWIEWQFGTIWSYLKQPTFESNIDFAFFRNTLGHQTGATGERAQTLKMFLDFFAESLVPGSVSHFDFYIALDREVLNLASVNPLALLVSNITRDFQDVPSKMHELKQAFYDAPEVWNLVETISLNTPMSKENSINQMRALRTRTEQIARYFLDVSGTDTLEPILVDLSQKFQGKNIVFEEFFNLLQEHGVTSSELGGDLLDGAGLPGFTVSDPSSQTLLLDEQTKFETSLFLQNGEPVSGPVRLGLKYYNYWGKFPSHTLSPILVEANQTLYVVIESVNPVQHVWVEPYLSLNRMNIRVDLPSSEEFQALEFVRGEDPFVKSIEERGAITNDSSSITIDDLDPGFSIVDDRRTSTLNNAFIQSIQRIFDLPELQMDQGLPVYDWEQDEFVRDGTWLRTTDPTAYGKYRRTFTMSNRGDGLAFAQFSTELPKLGEWRLEYYRPEGFFNERVSFRGSSSQVSTGIRKGTAYLEVRNGSKQSSHSVDVPELTTGWHTIETFDITDAEVDVLISNKTDPSWTYVVADAIRWTPVDPQESSQ
ncbi:MAG: hypothetical protein F4X56_09220 [Gammaproteobacteria bacterium]|nr:hypothetical protein [Gammaproteobacteria bacterium]